MSAPHDFRHMERAPSALSVRRMKNLCLRALGAATTFVALSLLPASARAEPSPISSPPAVTPGAATPSTVVLSPLAPAPPRRTRWRSPALFAAGIGGIVIGLPTMAIGGLAMALSASSYSEGGSQLGNLAFTGLIAATGATFIGLGIAGIVYGSAPVPDARPSLVPSVGIGPRSGALTWRF